MADSHKNFAASTVATSGAPSPATSGTSLTVQSGEGARFPAAPFNAVIAPAAADATPANAEVVRVTAISTDTLTITRAQESSSARTVVAGDRIYAGPTAKTLTDVEGRLTTQEIGGLALPWVASQAYAAGQLMTQSGVTYTRNSAGTSRTTFDATEAALWTALPFAQGIELGYADITANSSSIGTSDTDVTGLTITFTAPSRPVMLEARVSGAQQVGSTGFPQVKLCDSSNTVLDTQGVGSYTAGAFTGALAPRVRLASLTAGTSYTFKVRAATTAGTMVCDASSTQKGFIRAVMC
jgi:hypothetical protein